MHDPSLDETIPRVVMVRIAARPEAEAVVEPERRVTCGELGELALASTRALMGAGVGPGDRVAIWAPNGLGWIVAALGAQCAGAALVPINTRFKGEEAAWLLSTSKAPLLVTTVGFLDTDTVGMHALLACAGVADGTPGIERINFAGHRHLIDRMIEGGALGRGAAIGFISSAAGLGWEAHLEELSELLDTPDFDSGAAWFEKHDKAHYMATKQAVCAYVARQAFPMLKRGIRINAICPGPTDTPLAQANKEMWLGFGADYREEAGIRTSTPMEQAYPLLFLCSDAAAGINGVTVVTDAGYMSSGITGSFPNATMIARVLMGRSGPGGTA